MRRCGSCISIKNLWGWKELMEVVCEFCLLFHGRERWREVPQTCGWVGKGSWKYVLMKIEQSLFQLLLAAQVFHNLPGLTYAPHFFFLIFTFFNFLDFSPHPLWKVQQWEWPAYISIPAGTLELRQTLGLWTLRMNNPWYSCNKPRGGILDGFPDIFEVIQQFETPEAAAEVARSRFDCQPCSVPGRTQIQMGYLKRRKAIRTRCS